MIGIIDYNSGNIASVKNALEKLKFDYKIIDKPEELSNIDKVIFPGVGRASSAMKELKKRKFIKSIKDLSIPFLGICLGLQLLSDFSEEDNTKCMGIINGRVNKLPSYLKVPQIGWNKVSINKASQLFIGISDESYFYFVNSYYFDCDDSYVLAETDYGVNFASTVKQDNFYATQFHPEKSGEVGLKLLRNFCELC